MEQSNEIKNKEYKVLLIRKIHEFIRTEESFTAECKKVSTLLPKYKNKFLNLTKRKESNSETGFDKVKKHYEAIAENPFPPGILSIKQALKDFPQNVKAKNISDDQIENAFQQSQKFIEEYDRFLKTPASKARLKACARIFQYYDLLNVDLLAWKNELPFEVSKDTASEIKQQKTDCSELQDSAITPMQRPSRLMLLLGPTDGIRMLAQLCGCEKSQLEKTTLILEKISTFIDFTYKSLPKMNNAESPMITMFINVFGKNFSKACDMNESWVVGSRLDEIFGTNEDNENLNEYLDTALEKENLSEAENSLLEKFKNMDLSCSTFLDKFSASFEKQSEDVEEEKDEEFQVKVNAENDTSLVQKLIINDKNDNIAYQLLKKALSELDIFLGRKNNTALNKAIKIHTLALIEAFNDIETDLGGAVNIHKEVLDESLENKKEYVEVVKKLAEIRLIMQFIRELGPAPLVNKDQKLKDEIKRITKEKEEYEARLEKLKKLQELEKKRDRLQKENEEKRQKEELEKKERVKRIKELEEKKERLKEELEKKESAERKQRAEEKKERLEAASSNKIQTVLIAGTSADAKTKEKRSEPKVQANLRQGAEELAHTLTAHQQDLLNPQKREDVIKQTNVFINNSKAEINKLPADQRAFYYKAVGTFVLSVLTAMLVMGIIAGIIILTSANPPLGLFIMAMVLSGAGAAAVTTGTSVTLNYFGFFSPSCKTTDKTTIEIMRKDPLGDPPSTVG